MPIHKRRRGSGAAHLNIDHRNRWLVTVPYDRQHNKLKVNGIGQLTWNDSNHLGFSCPLDPVLFSQGDEALGGAVSGFWPLYDGKTNGWFNDGTHSVFTADRGMSIFPGTDYLTTRYYFGVLTGVKVRWTVTRTDHNDDFNTRIMMVPLTSTQISSLSGGSYPYNKFEGQTPQDQWANAMLQKDSMSANLTSVFSARPSATLKQYIKIKKYMPPDFPHASALYWWLHSDFGDFIESGNRTSRDWVSPDDNHLSYMWFGMYNDGPAGSDGFEHKLSVTFYYESFYPRVISQQTTFPFTGPTSMLLDAETKRQVKNKRREAIMKRFTSGPLID